MRVVPHLCFPEAGDTEITLPVDVLHFTCQQRGGLCVDRFVDPFAVRQPFLEMDECRISVKALEERDCSDLRIDPDQKAPQGEFREMLDRVEDCLLLMGEHE